MGSLRDQLLQAGLVSEQQARAAEEAKARRGGGPRPRTGAAPPPPTPPAPGPAAATDPEREQRGAELANRHRLALKLRGPRRWYFAGRRELLPYLELTDEAATMLERGQAGVVEGPGGETWLVDADGARQLRQEGSAWLRFWVG